MNAPWLAITRWLAISCAIVACASCVGNQPVVRELPVPVERIARDGYSLLPPNEAGWSVVNSGSQLLLGKRGERQDETFIINAGLLKLPPYRTNEELGRLIESVQAKNTETGRFVTIMHEVEAYAGKGADCVTSREVGEKLVPVKNSERTRNMILEIMSLTCAHPEDRATGIGVAYSRRHYPKDSYYMGDQDSAFFERAAAFFEHVEFNDL